MIGQYTEVGKHLYPVFSPGPSRSYLMRKVVLREPRLLASKGTASSYHAQCPVRLNAHACIAYA